MLRPVSLPAITGRAPLASGLQQYARSITVGSATSRPATSQLLANRVAPSPLGLPHAPLSLSIFARSMVLRGHAPWVKAIKAKQAAKRKDPKWRPTSPFKKVMPKLLGRKISPHVSRKAVRRALKTGHMMKRGARGLYGGKIIKFGNQVSESGNKCLLLLCAPFLCTLPSSRMPHLDTLLFAPRAASCSRLSATVPRRSRRTWLPNVQRKKFWSETYNRYMQFKMTAAVIKDVKGMDHGNGPGCKRRLECSQDRARLRGLFGRVSARVPRLRPDGHSRMRSLGCTR